MSSELVVILAISVAYFVKSVTGMGGPLLAIPIIAASTSVEYAVVVVSFANLLTNGYLVWEHRSAASRVKWIVIPLVVTGGISTVLGSWLLTEIDDQILSYVLAAVVFVYIVRFLVKPDFELSPVAGRRLVAPVGFAGGLLTGGTGSGGPVFATYLHALRLDRRGFIFSMSVLFQILNPIQMVVLFSLGSFTAARVELGVWALLPLLIVVPLGTVVSRRLPQRVFEMAVLVLLAFSAFRLVV